MYGGFETIVPKEFHAGILKLCKRIGTGTSPMFVPVSPEPYTKANECFANVQKKIARDGGEPQHGWIIWEAPKTLVEGEFHCTWRSPAGRLLCVSAREDNEDVLAFLPDHSRRFSGVPVAHISIAWPSNKNVERYLEKEVAFQRFKNQHTNPKTGELRCSMQAHRWHIGEIEAARRKIKL